MILKWTTTPPVENGWYWWRSGKQGIVSITYVYDRAFMNGNHPFQVATYGGEWAGPLVPPE
jgi:hypothetical protein